MAKERIYITPDYYKDFCCSCGDCRITCCTTEWSIAFDKNSYERYRQIKDTALREEMLGKMKRIKGDRKSDFEYAELLGDENGYCKMLTDDGYCGAQRLLGETFLSTVCKIFPRSLAKLRFDGKYETSLSFACPEVVKIAVFNENGINFSITEIDIISEIKYCNIFIFMI